MSEHVDPVAQFLWFMRPWPLVAASGASGGVFGLLVQVIRELSSDSPVLIPPEPELPDLSTRLDLALSLGGAVSTLLP